MCSHTALSAVKGGVGVIHPSIRHTSMQPVWCHLIFPVTSAAPACAWRVVAAARTCHQTPPSGVSVVPRQSWPSKTSWTGWQPSWTSMEHWSVMNTVVALYDNMPQFSPFLKQGLIGHFPSTGAGPLWTRGPYGRGALMGAGPLWVILVYTCVDPQTLDV